MARHAHIFNVSPDDIPRGQFALLPEDRGVPLRLSRYHHRRRPRLTPESLNVLVRLYDVQRASTGEGKNTNTKNTKLAIYSKIGICE